ncbi:MAG: aminotransferase class V-fold PLP-dependent enzyme [Bacteroidota bacterium]
MNSRRNFIKKTASASFLASLVSTQSIFASRLGVVEKLSDGNYSDLFMLGSKITYFNHASIGTIPKMIHEAHVEYLKLCETNPWLYTWSDPWVKKKEEVREKVADFCGCKPSEIALTHNTTSGMNLLASGLSLKSGHEVLYSSFNHSGARVCWEHYAKVKGYAFRKFQFEERHWKTEDDIVDAYISQLKPETKVVVIPHIDNIIGALHPVRKIAKAVKEKGVKYVAVDGAQSIGLINVNLSELGVDFYATSPHKWIQSPKGTGFLYMNEAVQKEVNPMIVTWGQKKWAGDIKVFEDFGTRDLPEVMAIGDAIDFQNKIGFEKSIEIRRGLRDYFKNKVNESDQVSWKSPEGYAEDVSIFAIEVNGRKANELSKDLYENHGFVFRPFESDSRNTIRISLNIGNTKDEIDLFFELI